MRATAKANEFGFAGGRIKNEWVKPMSNRSGFSGFSLINEIKEKCFCFRYRFRFR
jgi:hypothetical protein